MGDRLNNSAVRPRSLAPQPSTRPRRGITLPALALPALALPALALLTFALLAGSCAPAAGPMPIAFGRPCAICGMAIGDAHFACERKDHTAWRQYDSIECLLADSSRTGPAWLSDYDGSALHAADSLWVVRGDLPSPMGGGYAAFLDRGAADDVAATRRGHVARLAEFAAHARGATR